MDPLARRLRPVVERLRPAGGRILVATSGGPDSQSLLCLLAELRPSLELELWAAGVDHGLRAEARGELERAAALAGRLEIPFAFLEVTVAKRGNRLAAAREARYAALRRHAAALGAEGIAVAHTATDQAETVLLHLARGASLRGAAGMRARAGDVLRPLLDVDRATVRAYAERNALPFAEDPSNDDPARARTRVRQVVLPALRHAGPGTDERIAAFAGFAREDDDYLSSAALPHLRAALGPVGSLARAGLAELPGPIVRRVVDGWLGHHGIPAEAELIARLCTALRTGSQVTLSAAGRTLRLERGALWVEPPPEALEPERELPVPGAVALPAFDAALTARTCEVAETGPHVQKSPQTVAFDADRLHLGLRVRRWQVGDLLHPFGLDGHVRIGNLFTNHKVPRAMRAHWPVVVHGSEVVWVVGLRRAAWAPIGARTRHVVRIDLVGALRWGA